MDVKPVSYMMINVHEAFTPVKDKKNVASHKAKRKPPKRKFSARSYSRSKKQNSIGSCKSNVTHYSTKPCKHNWHAKRRKPAPNWNSKKPPIVSRWHSLKKKWKLPNYSKKFVI